MEVRSCGRMAYVARSMTLWRVLSCTSSLVPVPINITSWLGCLELHDMKHFFHLDKFVTTHIKHDAVAIPQQQYREPTITSWKKHNFPGPVLETIPISGHNLQLKQKGRGHRGRLFPQVLGIEREARFGSRRDWCSRENHWPLYHVHAAAPSAATARGVPRWTAPRTERCVLWTQAVSSGKIIRKVPFSVCMIWYRGTTHQTHR